MILRGQPTVCVLESGAYFAAVQFATWVPPYSKTIAIYRGEFDGGMLAWGSPFYAVPLLSELEDAIAYDAAQLACDPERGYVYLSFTRTDETAVELYDYTIRFVRSLDGGLTWSAPIDLSGTKCNGSQPVVGPDGEVYVIWEDFSTRQILGRQSLDFGQSFGPTFIVASTSDNLASGPPGYCPISGRVNPYYTSCSSLFGPGFPAVAIDRTTGPRRGSLYVAWSEAATGAVTSPSPGNVLEVEPNDHFATAMPVELGQNVGGFEASSDLGGGGDDYYALDLEAGTTLWLEGSIIDVFPTPMPDNPQCILMNLLCGADTLQMVSVATANIREDGRGPLPPLIYTAPASGRYYLYLPFSGSYSYSYQLCFRELVPDPASVARDHRDIVLAASSDGGQTWTPKVRVNDDPPLYDNSLPDVAVDGAGRVHVAWYDRRVDPACGELAHTYLATSEDGGVSFGPSCRISEEAGSWQTLLLTSDSDMGDRLALATSGEEVHVLWTQAGRPDLDIYAASVVPLPTPTALVQEFAAAVRDGAIEVSWRVRDPSRVASLRLYRAADESEDLLLREWSGDGAAFEYRFRDENAAPGVTYAYRLEVILRNGSTEHAGPVEVAPPGHGAFHWAGAWPNPFRSEVSVRLRSDVHGQGRIRVYDVSGREVITLFRGAIEPGETLYTWDGRSARGMQVPGGIYWVEAEVAGRRTAQRVVRRE